MNRHLQEFDAWVRVQAFTVVMLEYIHAETDDFHLKENLQRLPYHRESPLTATRLQNILERTPQYHRQLHVRHSRLEFTKVCGASWRNVNMRTAWERSLVRGKER